MSNAKPGTAMIDAAIQKGEKQFRINRRDGFVWINPKTLEPELDKEYAMVNEQGFADQKHKLVSIKDESASNPPSKKTPARKLEMKQAVAPADEMLQS